MTSTRDEAAAATPVEATPVEATPADPAAVSRARFLALGVVVAVLVGAYLEFDRIFREAFDPGQVTPDDSFHGALPGFLIGFAAPVVIGAAWAVRLVRASRRNRRVSPAPLVAAMVGLVPGVFVFGGFVGVVAEVVDARQARGLDYPTQVEVDAEVDRLAGVIESALDRAPGTGEWRKTWGADSGCLRADGEEGRSHARVLGFAGLTEFTEVEGGERVLDALEGQGFVVTRLRPGNGSAQSIEPTRRIDTASVWANEDGVSVSFDGGCVPDPD